MKKLIYPDQMVYHVSIQPCFDKKLEASRLDFYHEDMNCKEVDLVLSTGELYDMLLEDSHRSSLLSNDSSLSLNPSSPEDVILHHLEKIQLSEIYQKDFTFNEQIERLFQTSSEDGNVLCAAYDTNGGSGGYVEYIFRYAAQELFGISMWDEPLLYKTGRNPDVSELELGLFLNRRSFSFTHFLPFSSLFSLSLSLFLAINLTFFALCTSML